jgi:arylsulfatase A-like enzyme
MSMNFQAANIGQKFSGYVVDASGATPATVTTLGPLAGSAPGLAQAFDYVDGALQRMIAALAAQGLTDSTLIIVTAKHGNSPVDPAQLRLINPATTLIPLINSVQAGLAAQVTDDTSALIWLKDHSRAAEVAAVLQANADTIGAESIYVGAQIDSLMGGELAGNPSRRPDIIVEPVLGVVYAAPASKLADHGGFHEQDQHVPLVVVYPHREAGTVAAPVSLQQIAPTILHALQLKKNALDAVRLEHTPQLPGLDDDDE